MAMKFLQTAIFRYLGILFHKRLSRFQNINKISIGLGSYIPNPMSQLPRLDKKKMF